MRTWLPQAESNRTAVVPIIAPTGAHPGPQRCGAGRQLLGLYAGDHALARGGAGRDPSTPCPRWWTSRRAIAAGFKRLMEKSRNFRIPAHPHPP